jgi:hypothetical protein
MLPKDVLDILKLQFSSRKAADRHTKLHTSFPGTCFSRLLSLCPPLTSSSAIAISVSLVLPPRRFSLSLSLSRSLCASTDVRFRNGIIPSA